MELISSYENRDRRAVVTKQGGQYTTNSVYFVEYFIDNKLIGRTQHNSPSSAELVAEKYTDCLDSDAKQFLSE
jgi:hypothetical protein